MDPVKVKKIQAINKYKKHQILDNLFLYSLTALACSLFCSSPFWFPSLYSTMKVFLFVSLPKICFVCFSSKFLFIVGNLIVLVLIGESKIFALDSLPASDGYYDEYVNRSQRLHNSTLEHKKERKFEKSFAEKVKKPCEDGEDMEGWVEGKIEMEKESKCLDGDEELTFPAEELNKRADDLIARVNKQRRLEARLLDFSSE